MEVPFLKGNNNLIDINFLSENKTLLDTFINEEGYIEGDNNIIHLNIGNPSYVYNLDYSNEDNSLKLTYKNDDVKSVKYINYINSITIGKDSIAWEDNEHNQKKLKFPTNNEHFPQKVKEYRYKINPDDEYEVDYIVVTFQNNMVRLYTVSRMIGYDLSIEVPEGQPLPIEYEYIESITLQEFVTSIDDFPTDLIEEMRKEGDL